MGAEDRKTLCRICGGCQPANSQAAPAGISRERAVARGQKRTVTPPVIWICHAYCDFELT